MDTEELYRQFGPMVVRRCRKLLRDPEEADDIAQDVFVRLIRSQETLTIDHPSSLLYRIATNLCLNRIRDRRRKQEDPVESGLLEQIACSDIDERRIGAKRILDNLFSQHVESTRTIAVLHYVDGLTLQEVADEVGMSMSGIRKRLRVLRGTLTEIEDL